MVKIGAAAEMLGTTPGTLRRWESTGELLPARKTKGGTRYYAIADLLAVNDASAPTIGYARVSGQRQKDDLKRQQEMLATYGAAKGWRMEVITDLGSGMNYHKPGLQRLIELILRRQLRRLVLTHKDRLLRFGAELVFALCEQQGVEVVIIHQGEQPSFEEELAQDVLEIITVFSARLYGSRSKQHRRMLEALTETEVVQSARQLSFL
jgi:predicted site-specific integrase-resolvase